MHDLGNRPPIEGNPKKGASILLVGGLHPLVDEIVEPLTRAGHRVTRREHGAVARLELYRNRVDLLLVDAVLPDGSGLELGDLAVRRGLAGGVALLTEFSLTKAEAQWAQSLGFEVLGVPRSAAELLLGVQTLARIQARESVGVLTVAESTVEPVAGGTVAHARDQVERLAERMDAIARGEGSPRRAVMWVRGMARWAEEVGFSELARVVQRIADELIECDEDPIPSTVLGRIDLLVQRCADTLPMQSKRETDLSMPLAPPWIAVERASSRAVGLIRAALRRQLPLLVVPSNAHALEIASTRPIQGALLSSSGRSWTEVASQLGAYAEGRRVPLMVSVADGEQLNWDSPSLQGVAILHADAPVGEAIAAMSERSWPRTPMRVLCVDDDPVFRTVVRASLQRGGAMVHELEDTPGFIEAVRTFRPDAVLIDMHLPSAIGVELCRRLKADGRLRDLPVIFVSSDASSETREMAFEAGGDEFLLKPVLTSELLARVRGQVALAQSERRQGQRDPLTGLPNRESIRRELASRQDLEDSVAVGIVRLRSLGHLNRQHGYDVMNQVVATVGERLAREVRGAFVGRWTGSSFAVIGSRADDLEGDLQLVVDALGVYHYHGVDGDLFTVPLTAKVSMLDARSDSDKVLLQLEREVH